MGDTIRCVSDHAEDLSDGRVAAVGEFYHDVDLKHPTQKRLLKEGRIIRVPEADAPEPEKLTGDALQRRAQDLDIQGRSDMSADQLRAAIADAEDNTDGEEE